MPKQLGNRYQEQLASDWVVPHRAAIALLVFVVCFGMSCSTAYRWFCYMTKPPYALLIDELPDSARLLRYEMVRHGVDCCHLFLFACSNSELCDALVANWSLREVDASEEQATSFAVFDHPHWWTPHEPKPNRIFVWKDEQTEQYLSVWEHLRAGRLYVELGRW